MNARLWYSNLALCIGGNAVLLVSWYFFMYAYKLKSATKGDEHAFVIAIAFSMTLVLFIGAQVCDWEVFSDVADVMSSQISDTTTGTACWSYLASNSSNVYFLLLSVLWTCGIGTLRLMIFMVANID